MSHRALALTLALLFAARPALADDLFEKHVRPVLVERCFKCHDANKQRGGVRLDAPEFLAAPADGSGPLVVPGKPDESRLLKVLRHDGDVKMPPDGKLPDATVQAFADWVKAGAKWPAKAAPRPAGKHWAFQPVQAPPLPGVKDAAWPANAIDHFVLARLEAKGLAPSAPADRRTLLRRVSFDLTGLPPTPEQTAAFVKDTSAEALAAAVDRLLSSQAFGERWGRHWLDVARYSDTKGVVFNEDGRYAHAFRYRDWVVKALNDDLPYDQFLLKQVAADHQTRVADHPDLAALGFLTLGRKFENSEPDIIDDRLDVIFRGTQALSVGCARCHDHKYDPIPIRDYYSLYGVFAGAKEQDVPLIHRPEDRVKAQVYAAERRARARAFERFRETERRRLFGPHRRQADKYLLAAHAGGGEPKAGEAKRADGLNQAVVTLYKNFLGGSKADHHPVMAPWHAFAALKPAEFAAKGKALAKAFAANEDEAKPLNPLAAKQFAGRPPADLAAVAARYSKLFGLIAGKWEKRLGEADRADQERPTELDDPDEEAVRQVLFGDFAPLDDRSAIDISFGQLSEEKQAKHDELRKAIVDWRNDPSAPAMARVLEDPEEPPPQPVFVRGKAEQPGDEVPRRFLAALSGADRPAFTDGTGRYELARAIARKENPLTARVWANRVWARLLGRGLVATPSDFGTRGTPPTHPELLDWLADSLVQEGWSTKQLIRKIVLSKAYQQSSADRPDARKADPENALLWRVNRKRLEVEPLRDAMLAASGALDATVGGRPIDLDEQPGSTRRALYLKVDRAKPPGEFRAFDFANPDLHAPGRHETTVPQQALFLLNSPFVLDRARGVARRAAVGAQEDTAFLGGLYSLTFTRAPTDDERALAVKFLAAAAAQKDVGPKPPPAVWKYGHGEWDRGKKQLTKFEPMPHFQDGQWRGGAEYPHPALGYLLLSAEGGHPGADASAVAVRRWVAPADGAVKVAGRLKHALPEGEKAPDADGVKGYVFSAGAVVAEADVFKKEAATDAAVSVKAGQAIDFVVDPKANVGYDAFTWRVSLTFAPAGRPGVEIGYDSADDFAGPPPPTGPPLSPREKLAQVLLMSNEFLYLD